MTPQNWLNQALFLCRRGNLECELLLSSYAPIAAHEAETRTLFMQLLLESEDDLFAWLLASPVCDCVSPAPLHYRALILAIRNNYLIQNQ